MAKQKKPDDAFQPKGTLVIMLLFLLAIIVLWGSVYFILLSRGVTI